MSRRLNLLHALIFIGGMLVLAAVAGLRAIHGFGVGGPAALSLRADASLMNGELTHEFESHYDAVFPAKTFGVNLWAALELALFNEGRSGVRVGSDDWLYTAEEFRTYPDAQAQILKHLALIAWVRDQLAQRGAHLMVALVPAKARVYPEHVGTHRPAQVHRRLYPLVRTSLRSLRVHTPDLLRPLTACKQQVPVFLRTDTHWTPLGARCAAQTLGRAARNVGAAVPYPASYRTHSGPATTHRGDLFNFLPLDPYFARWLPPAETYTPLRTEPLAEGAGAAAAADLLGESPVPRVALIGTSYSADERWNFLGALQESLGEDVVNYAAEGGGPFVPMLVYLNGAEIRQAPPGLVVWEIPERYMPMGEDLSAFELPGFAGSVPTQGESL